MGGIGLRTQGEPLTLILAVINAGRTFRLLKARQQRWVITAH